MTTTRVSGFGASASPGLGGAAGVAAADTADAMATGPFLSPFDSSSATSPLNNRLLMSVSAQLLGLVSTNVCAMWPLTPPEMGEASRASGNAVRNVNRCVIGCDG